MSQPSTVIAEPPAVEQEVSFPARAFGYASQQYWAFLNALINGLQAYELQVEGRDYAPTPLPAA